MKVCELGDVCLIKRGTTITQKLAVDGLIPVVAGGLKPTYFHNTPNRNSDVITISGSGANAGFVNFWSIPIFASDCSTVEVKDKNLSINYVYYYLLSKQDYIYKELRSGAAQPHVYGKDIAKLKINLLPITEQYRLVAKLDALISHVDTATSFCLRNIKNVDSLLSSYVSKLFNEAKRKHSPVKLGDMCSSVEYGTSNKSSKIGSVPVLRMGNIINGEFDFSDLVFTDNDEEINKYKLNVGDVLFNRTNSPLHVGKSAVYYGDNTSIFAGYLIRVNYLKEKILPEFLCYYLNSIEVRKHGYSVMSVSVNQANINGSKLKDYPFFVPSIAEQKIIVEKINSMKIHCQSLRDGLKMKIDLLNKNKKSILKLAFNGELVKE